MGEGEKPDIVMVRVDGSKFITLLCSGYKVECPHCKKPIEIIYTLGTVEFKKPEEKKKEAR